MKSSIVMIAFAASALVSVPVAEARRQGARVELGNDSVSLVWTKTPAGWHLSSVQALGLTAVAPTSQHCVIYSSEKPADEALAPSEFGGEEGFPEKEYRYVIPSWKEATGAVALNRSGEATVFTPAKAERLEDGSVVLSYKDKNFSVSETWSLEGTDLNVTMTLRALRDGWYSMSTPSVVASEPDSLDFALIPGVLHGHELSDDFSRAYAYGWGVPSLPVIFRERSTSTLTSILTGRNGLTVGVTAEPGTAAEPWGDTARNTGAWRLGLSAMNRAGELSPTLYHPVHGKDDSYMRRGEERSFSVTYSFGKDGWWPVFRHAADDIYGFGESLKLRKNRRSLTDRLYGIHRYVVNDSTSRWHTVECEGSRIGAQEYLGGVYMAKKDAMKNADYGAMWMMGALTGDTLLTSKRLPYALNFKLKQHNGESGFFGGASRGQYYLRDGRRFVEEWGPYTEPIATTYYMLMDLGNISLFEPENPEVKRLIGRSADWLMQTQKADGSWAVAYSDADRSEAFADLKDYRPTFYGLLVAYRILGDEKYLEAARRGADWLIAEAVEPHKWLGVCGDTRFAADFATAQAGQAFSELYELTGDKRYLDAAVETARFYMTSVYTNPVASTRKLSVKGREREQWEITTSGLSYEHGGIIGSTNLHGPILLASHAGMFVRMYGLTGERMFLDMARAAAVGRDAFVDDETAVATYYWAAMNRGAGPYPHHAWWQAGWITDYLMAELELRSGGEIKFPAGFITPKVGPHRTYGFAPGKVYGEDAELVMLPGGVSVDNPNVELVLARSGEGLIAMLLNDLGTAQTVTVDLKDHGRFTRVVEPYGLETIKTNLK